MIDGHIKTALLSPTMERVLTTLGRAFQNPKDQGKLIGGGAGAIGGILANYLRGKLQEEDPSLLSYLASGAGGWGAGMLGTQLARNYIANAMAPNAQNYDIKNVLTQTQPKSIKQVLLDMFETPTRETIARRIKFQPKAYGTEQVLTPESRAARAELLARGLGVFDASKGGLFTEAAEPPPAWYPGVRPGDTHLKPIGQEREWRMTNLPFDFGWKETKNSPLRNLRNPDDVLKVFADLQPGKTRQIHGQHPGIYSNLPMRVTRTPQGFDVNYADRWDVGLHPKEMDELKKSLKSVKPDVPLLSRHLLDTLLFGGTAPVVSGDFNVPLPLEPLPKTKSR